MQSLAGVPSDLRVTSYNKEDRVSFDSNSIVQQAQGSMQVSLASLSGTTAAPRQTAPLSVASRRIIGSAPAGSRKRRRLGTHSQTHMLLTHTHTQNIDILCI